MIEAFQRNTAMELRGRRVAGWEHYAFLNDEDGTASKIPNPFGELWQKMTAAYAEGDLQILRNYGIPLVPTEIHTRPNVIVDGLRFRAAYLLQQPLLDKSHTMTYEDLFKNPKYQELLYDLVQKGAKIRREENLGLDLLGGKVIKMAGPALNPAINVMPAEVGNLLIADEDIIAKRDWPNFKIKEGDVILKKGEVADCDPRCYHFDRSGNIDEAIGHAITQFQEAQDTVLWSVLEGFGYEADFDFEKTVLRKMFRKLILHALKKMEAYTKEEEKHGKDESLEPKVILA